MNIQPLSAQQQTSFKNETNAKPATETIDRQSPQAAVNCQTSNCSPAGLRVVLRRLTRTLCDNFTDKQSVDKRIKAIISQFQFLETCSETLDLQMCLDSLNDMPSHFERLCYLLLAHSKLAVTNKQYQMFLELFDSNVFNGENPNDVFIDIHNYIMIHFNNHESVCVDSHAMQNFIVEARTLCRLSLFFFNQIILIKKWHQKSIFDDKCIQDMCQIRPLAIIWDFGALPDIAGKLRTSSEKNYSDCLVRYCSEPDEDVASACFRMANQELILKCLEKIRDNRRLLQNGEGNVFLSRYILAITEEVYQYTYREIKAVPLPERSLKEIFDDELKHVFLFGIGTQEYLSNKEIKYRKQLADCGYGVIDKLSECLRRITTDSEKSWQEAIGEEIQQFIEWADEYPHLAADICFDISLAFSKLESDTFFGPIKAGLKAKLIVHAFLGNLGEEKKYSFDPNGRYMHYLAIRDFCSYLPQLISGANTLSEISELTLTNAVFKTAGNYYKTKIQQRIGKQIPYSWTLEAISLINVLRGDSFYELLQSNAEMQAVKFAGTFRKAVLNPLKFWNYLKLEFLTWWRPLKQSEGSERVCRVFAHAAVPLASAAAAAALFSVVSAATAAILSLGLLTASYALYRLMRHLVDRRFQTDCAKEACKAFGVEQLKKDPEALSHLQTKVGNFIDNSRRTYALVQPETIKINPRVQSWFERCHSEIQGLVDDLKDKLSGYENNEIKEIIRNFNMELHPESLRKHLKRHHAPLFQGLKHDKSLAREYLAHHLIRRLEQEWLIPVVTRVFTESYANSFAESSASINEWSQSKPCAFFIENGSWSDRDIKKLVKKLAIKQPAFRNGNRLSDTGIEMIDHIFPRPV